MIAADLLDPSWRCVHFLTAGEAERIDGGLAGLERPELRVLTVAGAGLLSHDALLTTLGEAFSFPDYYGHNYSALDDCLRDLSWLPASAYVLRVERAAALWREAPDVAGALVETWLFCAEHWAGRQARDPATAGPRPTAFHLLFLI